MRMFKLASTYLALILFFGVGLSFAQEPVKVLFVADRQAVSPGGALQIGALFDVAEGWHIYWLNPGDSGLATNVRIEAPSGVTVGPLQWPIPEEFVQPGDLKGYGYQAKALLFSSISGVAKEAIGGKLEFAVQADWLACRDVCIRGKDEGKVVVGVQEQVESDVSIEFVNAAKNLPLDFSGCDASCQDKLPFEFESVSFEGSNLLINSWVKWKGSPMVVSWIPYPLKDVTPKLVSISDNPKSAQVQFRLKFLDKAARNGDFSALYIFEDQNGQRVGYKMSFPLSTQKTE
ncbi:MAG: hypothetical protein KDD53_06760 [Bdellovibrionales bacterium]|nr:hypothetical protein [Bdellovibrionales bacterium]